MFFIYLQKKGSMEWEEKFIPCEWWFFLGMLRNMILENREIKGIVLSRYEEIKGEWIVI